MPFHGPKPRETVPFGNLKAVFNDKKQVSMFEMTRLVTRPHVLSMLPAMGNVKCAEPPWCVMGRRAGRNRRLAFAAPTM